MRKLVMTLALATIAVLPGIASATHFGEVVVGADCDGWWAQVEVTWRTGIYSGNLDYTISLLDGEANVLEQAVWAGPIGRNQGDPQVMVYSFSGPWNGTFEASQFSVSGLFHIVAPWEGGVDDETATFTTEFGCTVATENSTWSTIKSLYR
jgi:hypothetical protein